MRRPPALIGCAAASALCLLLLAACQYPRDPEGTLNRVTDGTVRVGVIDALVKQFARELRARIDWVAGSEHALMAALEERELDLVIGGLDQRTFWKKHVAITAPYTSTEIVVGAPPGADLPEDLQGVRVAAERGSAEAGLLERETGAEPFLVDDLADARGHDDLFPG